MTADLRKLYIYGNRVWEPFFCCIGLIGAELITIPEFGNSAVMTVGTMFLCIVNTDATCQQRGI